ncbi:hypothetical protein Tco_1472295 [Tanacetum coccineum]
MDQEKIMSVLDWEVPKKERAGSSAFGLCLPFQIKNSGSAQESAGNNRKEGVHVAAGPDGGTGIFGGKKAAPFFGGVGQHRFLSCSRDAI